VSAWRRKAIALFPEWRSEFQRPGLTINDIFAKLVTQARAPHEAYALDATDEWARGFLERLHGYAEWCLTQPELWTDTAIGFYETLLAIVRWEWLVPWLSPFSIAEVEKTWALGVRGENAKRFEQLVVERSDFAYRTHVFATGAILHL
jgi:hypothetical protein